MGLDEAVDEVVRYRIERLDRPQPRHLEARYERDCDGDDEAVRHREQEAANAVAGRRGWVASQTEKVRTYLLHHHLHSLEIL